MDTCHSPHLNVVWIEYHHSTSVAIGTTVVGGREHGGDIGEGEYLMTIICVGIAHPLHGGEEAGGEGQEEGWCCGVCGLCVYIIATGIGRNGRG